MPIRQQQKHDFTDPSFFLNGRGDLRRKALKQLLALTALLGSAAWSTLSAGEELGTANKLSSNTTPWPFRKHVDRFVLYSNHQLGTANELLQEWLQLKSDIEQLLQLSCDRGEYHLVIFDRDETYKDYIQHYFPKVPLRRALFIKHRGPGIIFTYNHEDVLTDIRHEGTHALLSEVCGTLPLWLDEGLAEYFETPRDQRFSGSPHLKETRWRARLGQIPDLQRLESTSQISEMDNTDYRDAWAWVHFMLHRSQESRSLLNGYLAKAHQFDEGFHFHSQIPKVLPDLRNEFVAHFRSYPVSLDH
jgi:hypothetical protein